MQNYRYVFERPLLILTAIGAIVIQGKEPNIYLSFLPFILVFLLLINLWFTVNRMRSSARIAAYIQVALESPIFAARYIGWERSLRMYRIWMKKTKPTEREAIIEQYIDQTAIPDASFFYPPIYWFHVIMVSFALAISVHSSREIMDLLSKYTYISLEGLSSFLVHSILLPYLSFFSTIITGCIFYYYSFGKYRPGKIKNLIEVHRAIWVFLFNDEIKG